MTGSGLSPATGAPGPARSAPGRSDAARSDGARSKEAFHAVYEENLGAVHGFLRNRVGPQEADDLTAETFCRAYGHFDRWEDRGVPIRAWLLRIAYNLVVGRARQTSKQSSSSLDENSSLVAQEGHEERVHTMLEMNAALEALNSLSDSHRTVIELRYLRDLSVAETAEVLDLTPEAVRALSYRALGELRTRHRRQWSSAGEAE